MRQFDEWKKSFKGTQRFSEVLKTGEFKMIKAKVDLSSGEPTDEIKVGEPLDNMESERELIKN